MQQPVAIAQDLVLLGGGHAHVHVLKRFGMHPVPGARLTLVARDVDTPYSGMLPGYIAGHYPFAACHIDLGRLARFAGARLVHDEAIGLDRARCHVLCRAHPPIRYDLLSIDIGATPRAEEVPGAARHAIMVKPIDRFAERWEALLERARGLRHLRLAIVGGGAGGVELALAAEYRLRRLIGDALAVTLVTRAALLPSHNRRVARRFARILTERGIAWAAESAVAHVEPHLLVCADGRRIAFDEALWATEAGAAPWLSETGLPLDPGGFIAVDETLRSLGDRQIFAAGDIAAIRGHPREKAGVFAVRAGPPLAANLRRALSSRRLRRAVPQRRALALIGT
ncbi:MAG TPA: FAD-dependent oxidoreductase, partial [Stellaceae bacterium]|nr:FAD-dependent oxidoreductase [Stellaceae bacterium]